MISPGSVVGTWSLFKGLAGLGIIGTDSFAMMAVDPKAFSLRHPTLADGPVLHMLALAAGGLDVNTRYAYVLWARDFSASSVVASLDGIDMGCITGYVRPDDRAALFVWQVAVAPEARRKGLAGAMVSWLVDVHLAAGGSVLEATVTPSNTASRRLFDGVGARRGAPVSWTPLIGPELLGDGHEAEDLVRVGPFV